MKPSEEKPVRLGGGGAPIPVDGVDLQPIEERGAGARPCVMSPTHVHEWERIAGRFRRCRYCLGYEQVPVIDHGSATIQQMADVFRVSAERLGSLSIRARLVQEDFEAAQLRVAALARVIDGAMLGDLIDAAQALVYEFEENEQTWPARDRLRDLLGRIKKDQPSS